MEAIIRKQQERRLESNKPSAFRVRNHPVNPKKISRYNKMKHPTVPFDASEDRTSGGNMDSPGMTHATTMLILYEYSNSNMKVATPEAIGCYTPSDTGPFFLLPNPFR
jgi:hypothetical protein